jgi:methionyl-tRNA synthetase
MSKEKWVITAAWPYVNYIPHLGTFSQLLWGDIFTRYHKLRNHDVIYVSGSDAHGTPIVVAAEAAGVSPKDLAFKYHEKTLKLLDEWNIEFDKYSITHNPTHISFVQNFHKKIHKNGFFNLKETEQYYCDNDKRFLPDRFVEGICPICGSEGARGDQCTNPECENILKPTDLIEPHCITCHRTPILKKTSHWYFNLPEFTEKLKVFLEENEHIPGFAKQKLLSMIEEGLVERPISRDMTWGIPIDPIFGEEFVNKVLYVWFENVLGYVSTVKLLAEEQGKPDLFKDYWLDKDTKTVFCIGKDNIIFHALLFPAMLLATKDSYPLPYAVATTNFINFKEGPFSKSKGIGIWCDEATETLPADYWRYYLSVTRAELKDYFFDWEVYASTINVDLNDVIGNFIHRTITFISQHFEGKIPERGKLTQEEKELVSNIESNIKSYIEVLDNFKIKDATNIATNIARLGNQYFSSVEPWHLVKKDKEKTATTLNLSVKISEVLSILLWPIIPESAEKIWSALGFKGKPTDKGIDAINLEDFNTGQEIKKIKPIFYKIKADEVQKKLKAVREKARSNEKRSDEEMEKISYDEFKKVHLKIATIKSAIPMEKSKNLIKLIIDLGSEERQILAGIKQYYNPEDLVGRQIVVVTNLKPAKLMGEKSDGMLLAADIDGEPILLNLDKEVPPGTEVM